MQNKKKSGKYEYGYISASLYTGSGTYLKNYWSLHFKKYICDATPWLFGWKY